MIRVILIIASLILAIAVGGCFSPQAPAARVTPAPAKITVMELPSEAYIGEYITVKIKTSTWDRYYLTISNEQSVFFDLGYATPDDNNVVCWYFAIPPEGLGGTPTRSGNYILQIESEIPDGSKICLERNIIIKG